MIFIWRFTATHGNGYATMNFGNRDRVLEIKNFCNHSLMFFCEQLSLNLPDSIIRSMVSEIDTDE